MTEKPWFAIRKNPSIRSVSFLNFLVILLAMDPNFSDANESIERVSMLGELTNKVEIHGHRGNRGHFPENTLWSCESAIRAGIDYFEIDIGVTKDEVLVVHHDHKLNSRLCQNSDGSELKSEPFLIDILFSQVKTLDCGSRLDPRFPVQLPTPGAQIPSLEELFQKMIALAKTRKSSTKINIEVKSFPQNPSWTVSPKRFVSLLMNLLNRYDFHHRVQVQSFDPEIMREFAKQDSEAETSFLVEDLTEEALQLAHELGTNKIGPRYTTVELSQVQRAHALGLKVVPWTANQLKDWQTLIAAQVDGIITDYPLELSFLMHGLHPENHEVIATQKVVSLPEQ